MVLLSYRNWCPQQLGKLLSFFITHLIGSVEHLNNNLLKNEADRLTILPFNSTLGNYTLLIGFSHYETCKEHSIAQLSEVCLLFATYKRFQLFTV